MPRGRPPNIARNEARAEGLKIYMDLAAPCFCGCEVKYVANSRCVDCAIAKGKARYAGLDDSALAALKARDRERYEARVVAAGKTPRSRRRADPTIF